MITSARLDCRTIYYVNGELLLARMAALGLDEEKLAAKAGVSVQTVRNYQNSSGCKPWSVNSKSYEKVCRALQIAPSELQLAIATKDTLNADFAFLADRRFLGNPDAARSIAGNWKATSVDLEIPDFLTYSQPIQWHGQLTISQFGNNFEAVGDDKDGDGVYARGILLESGNWLKFDYWIENARLREYGTALMEYKGDGKTVEGVFIGRDAGHSNLGIVVAKITLTRE